ncbi:MAG: hypothetical protein V1760_03525, partial [Candidatus Peregrinibacteria bacterium]
QYKYGKILQNPGGPIIKGSEHTSTGKSTNLPPGTAIHPQELFSHPFNDPTSYQSQYPWMEEGGEIIKKIIRRGDREYVICARRMLRSENGERQPGRNYTEMHATVIPAEDWSVAIVPQLADILEAKGVTEISTSLPPIELKTDVLDQPLPENWLDNYVKELIANAVSGKPIALQDWDVSERKFLQKLFYCLICLPENLARQSSFGAGLAGCKEGEVRIAQTMSALGLRKIGGQWKGNTEEDVITGQRYLTALIGAIRNCTTPRHVMAAVQNIPQNIKREVEKRFQHNK